MMMTKRVKIQSQSNIYLKATYAKVRDIPLLTQDDQSGPTILAQC